MLLTKRMRQVLTERGETTKVATAQKMAELGLIEIIDRWVLRRGVPGQSAAGHKPGTMVIAFKSRVHQLKIWPEYFAPVLDGIKPFVVRRDDRGYEVGDLLLLCEYEPESQQFTGREVEVWITYILRGPAFGIAASTVIMGIKMEGKTE